MLFPFVPQTSVDIVAGRQLFKAANWAQAHWAGPSCRSWSRKFSLYPRPPFCIHYPISVFLTWKVCPNRREHKLSGSQGFVRPLWWRSRSWSAMAALGSDVWVHSEGLNEANSLRSLNSLFKFALSTKRNQIETCISSEYERKLEIKTPQPLDNCHSLVTFRDLCIMDI